MKGQEGDHKLSSKARMIFNDPIFNNVEPDLPVNTVNDGIMSSESVGDISKLNKKRKHEEMHQKQDEADSSDESSSDDSISKLWPTIMHQKNSILIMIQRKKKSNKERKAFQRH